jgi:acyl carrier protein
LNTPETNTNLPLERLLRSLENAGFKIGIRSRLNVQQVLQECGARYLRDPEKLGLILGPILAKSASEQEKFQVIFQTYLSDLKASDESGVQHYQAPADKRRKLSTAWFAAAISGLTLLAAVTILLWPEPPPPIEVNFTMPDSVGVGETVRFENLSPLVLQDSLHTAFDIRWEIGDSIYRELHATHLFRSQGRSRVSLHIQGRARNQANSKTGYLEVICPEQPAIEAIDFTREALPDVAITFSARVAPASLPYDYSWDFGDGTTATEREPVHTYERPGQYSLRLTINKPNGNSDCDHTSIQEMVVIRDQKVELTQKDVPSIPYDLEARLTGWAMVTFSLIVAGAYVSFERARAKGPIRLPEDFEKKYRFSDKPPYKIPFPSRDALVAPEPEIFAVADGLRERQQGEHKQLDLNATLRATVKKAGFVELHYRHSSKPAEYLVLIDRGSPNNLQFKLFEHLVERLAQEDVLIESFHYRTNPDFVWNESHPNGLTLLDLQRHYPGHRLVILGDGHHLVDPFSGGLPEDTERLFEFWRERALLTPLPPDQWTYKERLLQRLFVLLPGDVRGHLLLVEHFQNSGEVEYKELLSRLQPMQSSVSGTKFKRIDFLESFLPEPLFMWLAASAVYPNPSWPVLLAIGEALTPILSEDGKPLVTYRNLWCLSQIPWLQSGAIPPGLRDEFLAKLKAGDREIERVARTAVLDLLAEAVANLTFAGDDTYATSELQTEMTVQRAALDPNDEQVQRELRFLLADGRVNSKMSLLLNSKLDRQTKMRRALRVGVACVFVLWTTLSLGSLDLSNLLPDGPWFAYHRVTDMEAAALARLQDFAAAVENYNRSVTLYTADSLGYALAGFSGLFDTELRNDALHGAGLCHFYLDDLDSAAIRKNQLSEVAYFDSTPAPNLSSLIQGIEEHQRLRELLDSELFSEVSPILSGDRRWVRDRRTGLYGYVDGNNSRVIDFDFNGARDFREGRAAVKQSTRRGLDWFFIDLYGKKVGQLSFLKVGDFHNGRALVWQISGGYSSNRQVGPGPEFVDLQGKLIKPYDLVSDLQEGRIRVGKDGRFGFLDSTGVEVVSLLYDEATDFSGGIASVKRDGREFRIDVDGILRGHGALIATMIQAQEETIQDVAFSPDGRLLAAASTNGQVRVWEVNSLSQVREWLVTPNRDLAYAIAFTPDSKNLAVGTFDSMIRVWDARTGTPIRNFEGHEAGVGALEISHDGRLLLSGSWDGTVRLWDVRSGRQMQRYRGHDKNNGVAFSPDGRTIAFGASDNSIRLRSVADGREVTLSGLPGLVQDVCFSPDGMLLASVSDSTLTIWSVPEQKMVLTYHGVNSYRSDVEFSPDGKSVVCGDSADAVLLLDVVSKRTFAIPHNDDPQRYNNPESFAFSADGRYFASGGDELKLWDWQKILSESSRQTVQAFETSPVRDQIVAIIAKQMGIDPHQITDDATLREDLSMDAFDIAELLVTVDNRFGINIPDDVGEKIQTVGELTDAVLRASQRFETSPNVRQNYAEPDIQQIQQQEYRQEEEPPLNPDPESRAALNKARELGIEFALVPGGTFDMGDVWGDGEANERPVHTVTLSDFWMSEHEITNTQFCEFLNDAGNQEEGGIRWLVQDNSYVKETKGRFSVEPEFANHPVCGVTWYGARAFAEWVGGSLPTETQWEYAARSGGKKYKYATGEVVSHDLANIAGTEGNDRWRLSSPVGAFPPNESGLYDMAGNVREWCYDWYGRYTPDEQNDPTGPDSGQYRVFRGSSWSRDEHIRCSARDFNSPSFTGGNDVGFRIVLSSSSSRAEAADR